MSDPHSTGRIRPCRSTRRGLRPSANTRPASRWSHNRASSGRPADGQANLAVDRLRPAYRKGWPRSSVGAVPPWRAARPANEVGYSRGVRANYIADGRRRKGSHTRTRFRRLEQMLSADNMAFPDGCCQLTNLATRLSRRRRPKKHPLQCDHGPASAIRAPAIQNPEERGPGRVVVGRSRIRCPVMGSMETASGRRRGRRS